MTTPKPPDGEEPTTLELIAANVRRIEDALRYLPLPQSTLQDVRSKLAMLRGTLLEQRPPAFALIGRRGAGKSSLVNALAGAKIAELGHVKAQTGRGRWIDHPTERGALSVLDTRGVQEGSKPAEDDLAEDAIASIVSALKEKAPDVLIFMAKATEADSAIDADLDALERVYTEVERAHHFRPPLVVLATHCDLLEPKGTRLHLAAEEPPADVEEKLGLVAQVEQLLEQRVRERDKLAPHLVWTRGVCTYMSFRDDGTLRADERWRIDELVGALFKHLPDAGRGTFVRIASVRGFQEELANDLTRATAAICAAIAAIPIPVADLIPITVMQVTLIASIAWLAGRPLDKKAAAEFLGAMGMNVGVAFVFREGARALVKFVFPGGGSVLSGAVAFAGTMAVGSAASAYFLRGATVEEAKRAYGEAKVAHAEVASEPVDSERTEEPADSEPAEKPSAAKN